MQNKAFISFIAIVLALACIYHLSFTVITKKVESDAAAYANGDPLLERAYLDSLMSSSADVSEDAGWFDRAIGSITNQFTYASAKQRELNLGLDLKGGMNLTIEVSVADLLKAMANNTEDPAFNNALKAAKNETAANGSDLINNFVKEVQRLDPNVQLSSARMFGHSEQSAVKVGMTNEEVIAILRKEADQVIDRTYEVLQTRIDQFGVTQPNIQKLEATGRILIELPGIKDPERAVSLVQTTAKLEFWETKEMREFAPILYKMNDAVAKLKKANALENKSADTLAANATAIAAIDTNKTETTALADAADTLNNEATGTLGKNNIQDKENNPLASIIVMNTVFDPESQQTFLASGPTLGYVLPKDTAEFNGYLRIPQIAAMIPKDVKLFWGYKAEQKFRNRVPLYCISSPGRGNAVLEGDVVTNAEYEKNPEGGGFMVRMFMNGEGSEKWAKITEANSPKGPNDPGKSIAIVLDGKVYSSPTVKGKITGGISSITGTFTFEEAKSLAAVLKSGKLPVPATIVEKAVVGPSMGAKAINAGLISLFVAFIIVLIYMAFYYAQGGLFANLALLCNVFFLIGTLASIGTSLTLPGIAGIVLTFGMAVDANVLIYERIREELREGKGLRLAISEGYSKAYSSIIDGNVTTILVAIVLVIFGAGPTRGFAVTLAAGIFTSLFTALFITRLMFEARLKNKKNISFSTPITQNAFRNIHIDFIGKRKIFYLISTAIIIIGFISFFTKGFNLGVDLQGGRTYTVTIDNSNFKTEDLSNALTPAFGNEAPIVKNFGSNETVKIITKYKFDDSTPETEAAIEKSLYETLKPFYSNAPDEKAFVDRDSGVGITGDAKVGPTIAGDSKNKSIYAIGISLVLMFLYILFRFRGWQFGLGALVALAHNVLFVLAAFSLLDGIVPFSLEIDQAIIAAILTVIGYSINDTVVIFDRVREYFKSGRRGTMAELMNAALNSTLSRTFNTLFTTIIVMLVAFLFGGPGIRSMSFALVIGIAIGAYTSVCIAAPLVHDLKGNNNPEKEKSTDSDANVETNKSLA